MKNGKKEPLTPIRNCGGYGIYKNPGSRSVLRSSYHSQCLCSIFISMACMCSQLTPLSAPTCRLLHSIGSFSGASDLPEPSCRAPLGEHTQQRDRAEALQPFFKPGVKHLEEHQSKNCTRLRARHSPLNRFSNQCVTSYKVSTGKHCSISVTRQSAGPLALFLINFHRAHRILPTVIGVRLSWTATRQSPNPFGLHLSATKQTRNRQPGPKGTVCDPSSPNP